MKKKYINPEMELFEIQTMTVLAGSPGEPTSGVDPSEDPIEADDVAAPGFFGDDDVDW